MESFLNLDTHLWHYYPDNYLNRYFFILESKKKDLKIKKGHSNSQLCHIHNDTYNDGNCTEVFQNNRTILYMYHDFNIGECSHNNNHDLLRNKMKNILSCSFCYLYYNSLSLKKSKVNWLSNSHSIPCLSNSNWSFSLFLGEKGKTLNYLRSRFSKFL